jgi:diadenosine tetraphosphatase ApaH/serine/threonine PP2A family protein phosphatase
MLDGVEDPVLLGGHTHLQMVRRYEQQIIVNPGSVGLPFREWWPQPVRISPWAEYGIVGENDGRLSMELRQTPFDVDALLAMSLESGMPHAEWWANCWVRD